MKPIIGITEHGDCSQSYKWLENLKTVDGAILITKEITDEFIATVLKCNEKGVNLIVHCTCTGYGGSELEPNVPVYQKQIEQLKSLIDSGFPSERTVLRIDPIFPTQKGIQRVNDVLMYSFEQMNIPTNRIRISIVDEYKHVQMRYKMKGWQSIYNGRFQPNKQQLLLVTKTLEQWYNKLHIKFETCAEDALATLSNIYEVCGCVSEKDLKLFNLEFDGMTYNPQNRKGCHCLSCKKEILDYKCKNPCKHECVYCFWRNSEDV